MLVAGDQGSIAQPYQTIFLGTRLLFSREKGLPVSERGPFTCRCQSNDDDHDPGRCSREGFNYYSRGRDGIGHYRIMCRQCVKYEQNEENEPDY